MAERLIAAARELCAHVKPMGVEEFVLFKELRAAADALAAQPAAEPDDTSTDWRRLALQFDGHRMQALGHLRALAADPGHADAARAFLAAPPLSGEQVLADRIALIAAQPARARGDAPPDPNCTNPIDLWAEIARLRCALQGPEGFSSWQEAATAERVRRVKAEQALAAAPQPAAAELVLNPANLQSQTCGGPLVAILPNAKSDEQPAAAEPANTWGYERQRALMEANRNEAADLWDKGMPMTEQDRRFFEYGFDSGWTRGRAVKSVEQPAASTVPAGYVSPEQLAAHQDPEGDEAGGRYLPVRKTPAGKFTQPIYTAAPAGIGSSKEGGAA